MGSEAKSNPGTPRSAAAQIRLTLTASPRAGAPRPRPRPPSLAPSPPPALSLRPAACLLLSLSADRLCLCHLYVVTSTEHSLASLLSHRVAPAGTGPPAEAGCTLSVLSVLFGCLRCADILYLQRDYFRSMAVGGLRSAVRSPAAPTHRFYTQSQRERRRIRSESPGCVKSKQSGRENKMKNTTDIRRVGVFVFDCWKISSYFLQVQVLIRYAVCIKH